MRNDREKVFYDRFLLQYVYLGMNSRTQDDSFAN